MEEQPWTIIGAGAIGGLWACHLHQAKMPVQLILRSKQRLTEYKSAGGLCLEVAHGADNAQPVKTVHTIPAFAPKTAPSIKRLLICTKSHQTLNAIKPLMNKLNALETVVLLQNGLGSAELLTAQFAHLEKPPTLILGTSTEGAWRKTPFHIMHAGTGKTLFANTETRQIQQLLQTSLRAEAVGNIDALLWQKLCINSVINPLCVIHQCKNGELLEKPTACEQINQLLSELESISQAQQYSEIASTLKDTVYDVIERTAQNQCSMWQDVQNKQSTEIEAICGYALMIAKRHNIQCPALAEVYKAVKAIEASY